MSGGWKSTESGRVQIQDCILQNEDRSMSILVRHLGLASLSEKDGDQYSEMFKNLNPLESSFSTEGRRKEHNHQSIPAMVDSNIKISTGSEASKDVLEPCSENNKKAEETGEAGLGKRQPSSIPQEHERQMYVLQLHNDKVPHLFAPLRLLPPPLHATSSCCCHHHHQLLVYTTQPPAEDSSLYSGSRTPEEKSPRTILELVQGGSSLKPIQKSYLQKIGVLKFKSTLQAQGTFGLEPLAADPTNLPPSSCLADQSPKQLLQ